MKLLMTGFMFLLDLFPMMEGGGWALLKLRVPFWGDFCREIQTWKNGVTIKSKNSL